MHFFQREHFCDHPPDLEMEHYLDRRYLLVVTTSPQGYPLLITTALHPEVTTTLASNSMLLYAYF